MNITFIPHDDGAAAISWRLVDWYRTPELDRIPSPAPGSTEQAGVVPIENKNLCKHLIPKTWEGGTG